MEQLVPVLTDLGLPNGLHVPFDILSAAQVRYSFDAFAGTWYG